MFYNKFDTKDNTTWAARKWVCQEAQCQYAWRTVLRMWLCMWLYALQLGKGSPDDYVKGGDIFDIWFDSGVSWATVLKGKCVCERERIGLIPKVNRKFLWKQPRDMHHIYIYTIGESVCMKIPLLAVQRYTSSIQYKKVCMRVYKANMWGVGEEACTHSGLKGDQHITALCFRCWSAGWLVSGGLGPVWWLVSDIPSDQCSCTRQSTI